MKYFTFFCLFFLIIITLTLSASPKGDVVGKVSVGYQGWFSTTTDGSPGIGGKPAWWHWSKDRSDSPSPSNRPGLNSWPDMRDYTKKYKTKYPNLGNGQGATLFSSFDTQTVHVHFKQMAQNEIDTVALQRFNPRPDGEGPIRDAVTKKVAAAAEKYERKFYIMYDVSGWSHMRTEIKTDWLEKMSKYNNSPAYAKQNGKPVVSIWGFGLNDDNHNFTASDCLDVINWFKNEQGVYLIGGVPAMWRKTEWGGVRKEFFPTVFSKFDMISPWLIGRIGSIKEADSLYKDVQVDDMTYCRENKIDYQPCVLPGDLKVKGQRQHGDFMWHQFYNMKKLGANGIYISMFDEYQEGNQVAKTAENSEWIPKGSDFATLDEDGVKCTADYYLRLTKDGSKMFKGVTPLTDKRHTIPWPGQN